MRNKLPQTAIAVGGDIMRKWLKKSMVVGLALAMTVGLSACGGADGSDGNGGGSGNRGNSSANAQLAKENVYKVEEFEFPKLVDPENGYVNVYSTEYRDGRIYMVVEISDWTREENGTEYDLIIMNADGSDTQVVKLDTSGGEEGSAGEGSGDGDSAGAGSGSEGSGDDGSTGEGSGEEGSTGESAGEGGDSAPVVSPRDLLARAAGDVADPGMVQNTWEYTSFGNFSISSEGKVFGVKNHNYEDYSNPEQYVSENHTYICCWDTDGSRLWETELEDLRSGEEGAEWIYISSLIPGKDGSAKLLLSGDNMYRMDISSDGEISEREQLSEETGQVLSYRQDMIVQDDGTMLITYSDESDWTKMYLATYDPETDTLGEPANMPSSFGWNGYGSLNAGVASDLVFTMSDGVYIFNKGDEAITKKMDFVNSDVNISNFVSLVELDKDSFVGIFYENYGDDMKAALFTYRDPADIPDKSVIVLAGNWIDNAIRQRAVEFNRASDVYRVVIRGYDSYNNYDDYNAGITRLNNDIVTGSMPDILIAENLPIENYISKGLIADVGKLIEEDPELSQVEFLQNVFDAYSVDGKLYYVVPTFSVNTMIAKTSLVGDRTGWTLEEMKQTVESMGENVQAIGEVTRDGFMSTAMQYCGNDFIDVETGKCSFNTENFISMMEYAKTLPEEIDWENTYTDDYWMTYESQYRDNRTLLMQLYIASMDNLKYSLNGNFGEPVTFIGFPTESGKGSYISANQSFVLSAKSANLDGAWEFVRYYLTDEYQNGIEWGLSVNKQVFMERAQKATQKPTYTDENGNEVEYDDTFYLNGEDIPLDPLSQEQVDQIVNFVMSVDRAYYYNEDVLNIINEEMGAFYTGQKSAQDVANVIQSRAQIYVDENR